jgi:hypothetical protein
MRGQSEPVLFVIDTLPHQSPGCAKLKRGVRFRTPLKRGHERIWIAKTPEADCSGLRNIF